MLKQKQKDNNIVKSRHNKQTNNIH